MQRGLLLGVIFVIANCSALIAQESEQYRNCINKANTQTAMHICANEEAVRVDAQLNDIHRKLVSAASNEPSAIAKITAAQTAWVAYRDAYIEAMYPAKDKQATYGSIFPMEVDLLRAKLTRQQIEALKDLLRHYRGSKQQEDRGQ